MKSLLIIVLSLASVAGYAQRNKEKPVQEDLASLRPHFTPPPDTAKHYQGNPVKNVPEVKPTILVNSKVNAALDSIDKFNRLRKVVQGYTIQVYSGLNSEQAREMKRRLQDELDMRANMQYLQPKWRVNVGSYFTTLDAQKDLQRLKRSFPNAILIPENIPIR